MHAIYFSFQCFVMGYVYAELLISEGHILHPLYKFFEKKLTRQVQRELPDHTPDEVRQMAGYVYKPIYKIEEKKHWLLKPLGGCVYCTTGQLCLWALLIRTFLFPHIAGEFQHGFVIVWQFVFCISLSILMVMTCKKLFERWSTSK